MCNIDTLQIFIYDKYFGKVVIRVTRTIPSLHGRNSCRNLQILPTQREIIPLRDLFRKDGDAAGIRMPSNAEIRQIRARTFARPLKSRHGNLLPTRALRTTGEVFSVPTPIGRG